jgi:ABC-type multidrug transport system fused ATPase/permease subunit
LPQQQQQQQQQQQAEDEDEAEAEEEEEEERSVGRVRWLVYRSYLSAVGWLVAGLVLASLLLMQVGSLPAVGLPRCCPRCCPAAAHASCMCCARAWLAVVGGKRWWQLRWWRGWAAQQRLPRPSLQASRNGTDLWISFWVSGSHAASNGSSSSSSSLGPAAAAALPLWAHRGWQAGGLSAWPGLRSSAALVQVAESGFSLPQLLGSGAAAAAGTAYYTTWAAAPAAAWHGSSNASSPAAPIASRRLLAQHQHRAAAAPADAAALQRPRPAGSASSPARASHPSPAQLSPDARRFLAGLLLLAALNTAFTLARAFSFAFAGLRAARLLHSQLLQALLRAPMGFLDSTPKGRLLNRFSSDINTVDDSLPFIMNILLANAVSLLLVLAVLAYSQPLLLALLPPLALLYRWAAGAAPAPAGPGI